MLLIGAALLGGFILFVERGSETSLQRAHRTRTVFAARADTIDWLLFDRNGVQIECIRTPAGWQLVRPVSAPADNGLVEKMIDGLARVERGEVIPAETLSERGLAPADYGFDAPRARITFKNSHGTFTWLIGRDAPVGKTLYVMPEGGGDIIAAPQTLLHLVPQDPSWIRDHALFTGEPTAARGLDLRRPAGFLQLRQPEKNHWLLQQPQTGRADLQSVHALFSHLFSGTIQQFIAENPANLTAYGLDKPAYELAMFTQDERTQTLLIGQPSAENAELLYAKRVESNSIFTIPAAWVKELDLSSGLLRSRQIVELPAERITAIHLTRSEQQIELQRTTNSQWQLVRPIRWEAAPSAVTGLLSTLCGASVQTFIDTPTAEETARMAAAPWEAVLSATDGPSVTLRISEPGPDGLRLVQSPAESTWFAASENIVRDPFADPLFYRDLIMLEINPLAIQKITLQRDGTEHAVQKKPDGSFSAVLPDRQVAAGALTDLLWTLNDLHAQRHVALNPASLKPYGLDQPPIALTVALSDTNVLGRVVLIGQPTEGGRFAMIQGQDIVFVIPEAAATILTRELTEPLEKPIKNPAN
jgi:hypothetical protein